MGFRDSDEGLSPVIGTLLIIIVAIAISATAWLMFSRATEEKLSGESVQVGFSTDSAARTAEVVTVSRPMEWGTDLLVSGDCNASLNGGNITGPVQASDILRCANAGELRITTSVDLGSQMIYRTTFQ